MRNSIIVIALALALAFAGCIQNMGDLKDRLGATKEEPLESAEETAAPTPPTLPVNETPPAPPVARISVFGPNGALLYKSSFTAEDPAEIVFVEENTRLTVNAADSAAVERGATVTAYAWTLNGKAIEGGRSTSVEVGAPALYLLTLTVTDSKGSSDAQTLKLGVAPPPFEVVTELTTTPVVGVEGEGEAGVATFTLGLAGDAPAMVQGVTFEAIPGATCDVILDVVGPDGASLGARDKAGFAGRETITTGALPLGAYEIRVAPFVCAAPDGVPLKVTVLYMPMIEGLDSGDGHAHGH